MPATGSLNSGIWPEPLTANQSEATRTTSKRRRRGSKHCALETVVVRGPQEKPITGVCSSVGWRSAISRNPGWKAARLLRFDG